MTDNRGTEITIGATVAYNFSGEIAIGKVERIIEKKDKYEWGKHKGKAVCTFHVRRETHKGHWAKGISQVTRPENLMVIFEDLCPCGAKTLGAHKRS